MYINLCPRTVGIHDLTPGELIDLAAAHGFGGLDLHLDGISSIQQAQNLRSQLDQRGLRWGLFWLPADFIECAEGDYEPSLDRLRAMLPLVQAAGCARTYMHIWPSSVRPFAENLAHHRKRLGPIAKVLSDHGVQLGLEFLGPLHMRQEHLHPFIYRLPEMLEFAIEIHPSVGVVIDMFHWHCGGGTAAEVRGIVPADRIINVHANDARLGVQVDQQHNYQRELPLATGVVDALGLIKVLRDIGYDGPVIAEPFHPQLDRLSTMVPAAIAEEIIQIMRRLVEL